jgi:hypothetical protein
VDDVVEEQKMKKKEILALARACRGSRMFMRCGAAACNLDTMKVLLYGYLRNLVRLY